MFYYYLTSFSLITVGLIYYLFPINQPHYLHLIIGTVALGIIILFLVLWWIGFTTFKKSLLLTFCFAVILLFIFRLTSHQTQQQARQMAIRNLNFFTNQFITAEVVKVNGFKNTRFETLIKITPTNFLNKNQKSHLSFNALLYTRVQVTNQTSSFLQFKPDYITMLDKPSAYFPDSYRKYLISRDIFASFTAYRTKVKNKPNQQIKHRDNHTSIFRTLYLPVHATLTTKTWTFIKNKVDRWISPPANGLAYSLLTGDKTELSKAFKENFRRTGTYHVLAVSGMHALLLTVFFFYCFRLLGFRKSSSILPVVFIVLPLYLVITSGQISIFRTYLMVLTAFILHRMDRKVNLLAILNLVFISMVIYSPALLYNISLQLSFSAVLGIGLTIELLKLPLLQSIKSNFLKGLLVSTGAQLGTLSFVIYYFGYANFFALFYNLVVSLLITVFYLYTLLFFLFPLNFIPNNIFGVLNISDSLSAIFGKWLSFIGKLIDYFLTWSRLDLDVYEFTNAQHNLPLAIGLFLSFFFFTLLAINLLKHRTVSKLMVTSRITVTETRKL